MVDFGEIQLMVWSRDNLAPVETLLFRSQLVKIGYFHCDVHHPCFSLADSLDNDVFVFACSPLWIRRDSSDYRFVERGGIFMHRTGTSIERKCAASTGDRAYWFGIRPDVFVEVLLKCGLPTDEMGGALIAEPRLRFRFAAMIDRLNRGHIDRLLIEEEVLALFHQICEKRANKVRKPVARLGTESRRRHLTDATRAFVDAHLTENFKLQCIAQAIGTSTFHLCRTFKEETSLTLRTYRTRQRVGLVIDRIVGGDTRNLSDLALESGFCSHSHLSRAFHQHLGVPPSSLHASVI